MTTQAGWAIFGEHGLYNGWGFTRSKAIAGHVYYFARREIDDFRPWPEFDGTALSPKQRKAWEKCRREGDRCVKVQISYEEPSK